MKKQKRKILLVTGLSGAGLSTALKALEDAGYKAVDNLPLAMVDDLLRQKEGRGKPVAIGIDSRTWDFAAARLLREIESLKKRKDLAAELVFLDCQNGVLQQRYTETRRVHPLAMDRPVGDGVAAERRLMRGVRNAADHVIDTTDLNVHDLRRLIASNFAPGDNPGLMVFVMSFGFKNGLPREADLVFDVRFLDNPHWNPALRPLTGLDHAVARMVKNDKGYKPFFVRLADLLATLLPRYDHEGKRYLTVAIGCTGGKHRSVCVAEDIYKWLDDNGISAAIRHRDIAPVRRKRGKAA